MTKHTMELVWHSCEDCLPEENWNGHLFVTDGHLIMQMTWKRTGEWQRFESYGWYIEPGINAKGYWWADLAQTIQKFAPIQNTNEKQDLLDLKSNLAYTTLKY